MESILDRGWELHNCSEKQGSTWTDYVFFGNQRIVKQTGSSATTATYTHTDHLGSTRVCTNSSGNSTGTCHYEPFGEIQPSTTCSVGVNYRYAGMEFDSETGLYHTWFRQYDPNQGRWLSVDPLAGSADSPQSLDRYVYVLNDPINLVDPLGLSDSPGEGWIPHPREENCWVNLEKDEKICKGPPAPRSGGSNCRTLFLDGGLVEVCSGGKWGWEAAVPKAWDRIVQLLRDLKIGIRQPGESFTQCMAVNANTYSIGGGIELTVNVLTGTNTEVSRHPLISALVGNQINTFLFGSAAEAGATAGADAPGLTAWAMGSPTTFGRRTSDIMSLNIAGTPGGPPLALSPASRGVQGTLGRIGNVLNLGMSMATRLAVDAALTAAEAGNCAIPK